MDYQVTIRYGKKSPRYHSFSVEAGDVPSALRKAADEIPEDIAPQADLVELREAPDFDKVMPPSEFP